MSGVNDTPSTGTTLSDEVAMREALALAAIAQAGGEVPVGAVVVKDGVIIGRGFNRSIEMHDATAHAEIQAMRQAGQHLKNYRLHGCTLYVTLEPCAMCAGALINARMGRVVFGATEPKTGAAGSVLDVFGNPKINHQTRVEGGLMAAASQKLLSGFFEGRRRAQQQTSIPLRDDALRTPDAMFASLSDFEQPLASLITARTLPGLRLQYVDTGSDPDGATATTWLLVHPSDSWGWAWRHWLTPLTAMGCRVIAPDMIGFGRSDKPKRTDVHTPAFHAAVLKELISHTRPTGLRILLPNDPFGIQLADALTRQGDCPPLFSLAVSQTPSTALARDHALLPYVDKGYRAGPNAIAAWQMPTVPTVTAGILSALPHHIQDLAPDQPLNRKQALLNRLKTER